MPLPPSTDIGGARWSHRASRCRSRWISRHTPQEKVKAMQLYRLFVDAARGARPYSDLETSSRPYLKAKWYEWLAIPPRGNWIWAWYPKVADFNTLPVWRRVHVPVLIVYGER